MSIVLRGAFAYDGDEVSDETGLYCDDESLTVQSEAEDADINTLVRRFGLTGELPENLRVPINEDFVAALDFKDAMNVIREADAAFMEMPADVRKRFNHDAGEFVNFCSDESNIEEMRKLGLAVPEVLAGPAVLTPVVEPVIVAPETPSKA